MGEAKSEVAGSLVAVTKQQAMLLLEAGYLWMDLGDDESAREVFHGAMGLMPKSEVPQIALGTLELNRGTLDKALQAFRAAQRLAPKAALPRAHAGEALLHMGKLAEAKKELAAAIELADGADLDFAQSTLDGCVDVLVAAAYAVANRGDVKKARELLATAAKEDAESIGPMLGLGDVEASQGNLAAAKGHFQRASELAPKDPVPKVRMAALALDSGEKADALKLAQEAKKLATAAKVSPEASAAIDQLVKQARA